MSKQEFYFKINIHTGLNIRSVRSRTGPKEPGTELAFFSGPNRTEVMLWTEPEPDRKDSVRFFLKEPNFSGKKNNETASLTNLNIQTTVKLQISNALTNTTDLYNSPFCPEVELLY